MKFLTGFVLGICAGGACTYYVLEHKVELLGVLREAVRDAGAAAGSPADADRGVAGVEASWRNRELPIEVSAAPEPGEAGYGAHRGFHMDSRLLNLEAKLVDGHRFDVTWTFFGNRRGVYPAKLMFAVYDQNGVLLHRITGSNNGRMSLGYMEFIWGERASWKVQESIARAAHHIVIYFLD